MEMKASVKRPPITTAVQNADDFGSFEYGLVRCFPVAVFPEIIVAVRPGFFSIR